jgi:hypothetical protein
MTQEFSNFGDNAVVTMQANANIPEGMGIEGWYHIVCRDKDGNIKWEEETPNLVVAVGKQLMLNTLLYTASGYTLVGPYLGLISNTFTASASDTMASHSWTEFTNYTVLVGSTPTAQRGTAVFNTSTSTGSTPANITSCTANAITYSITGSGGTVYGCFLVTGSGAVATFSSTAGTLYSEGLFGTAKTTTAGDTVSVTYSTTATS